MKAKRIHRRSRSNHRNGSAQAVRRGRAVRRRPSDLPAADGRLAIRKFDSVPDRVDIRDWVYQPRLVPLPDQIVNCDYVPQMLDQGREGACTGFALAAVINFQLAKRNLRRSVSPRMLYEMARRYDEWPGEAYDGSSARGAMKGWVAHGVCSVLSWPLDLIGADQLSPPIADEARGTPGGAYYRVMHRQVRDMHAALHEAGILYVTLMVHDGWFEPGPTVRELTYVDNGNLTVRRFPVIERKGRADNGHAIAIVGYTDEGFIIQNSWGSAWGAGGFALLPYEDYLLHATDVWVAQLGVPLKLDLWSKAGAAETTAGLHRAEPAIPISDIRPFVIDVGNNGELSDSGVYWTTEKDLERLFSDEIPTRTLGWQKKRVLLYLHGGLNDERTVARRVIAFRDVLLENQIYPLHIMWESGVMESLSGMLQDLFTDADSRAGRVASWLDRFRDGLEEAKDRTLELTAATPGTALWSEMKENASLSSTRPDGKGGLQLLAAYEKAAIRQLNAAQRAEWELHVVGHSAGSIFSAYAMSHLLSAGVPLKTIQFMAPAIAVDLFKKTMLPQIKNGRCPHPTLYVLSDSAEREDRVGPYGKSLLYLVSNAFEGRRCTPILGMERFVSDRTAGPNDDVDPEMNALFKKTVDGLPSLVVAGDETGNGATASQSRSDTHGGFDNDPATMNSILRRILRGEPTRLFTTRDLQY